jgi:peptide/nickel transport system substrate-binding protein
MIQRSQQSLGRYVVVAVLILLIGLGTACAADPVTPDLTVTPDPPTGTPTAVSSPSPTPLPTATPTPTPLPPKELTICQGREPSTLFIYGRPSPAARNVLNAVYDGPVETREYAFQGVILEQVPTIEGGDAALRTVQAGEGDRVLSTAGGVVELQPGVAVVSADGEETTFDGGTITMTQMVVTFTLRADVTWADGEPLTAEDSRFSYELAGQLDDAALHRQLDRTASYRVEDPRTIVWTGVPGFRDTYYLLNFYHPLPQHALQDVAVEDLLRTDGDRHTPLGWGPFVIEAWEDGDHIALVPNPHYFRAAEGLPRLDRLTFRFLDEPERAMEDLLSGACDVLSEDLVAGTPLPSLLEATESDGVRLVSEPSSEWEHLDFGIQPARWSGRVPFFADPEVRKALAQCIDRERLAQEAFPHADAPVAHSYVLPQHPLHAGDALQRWPHDPGAGRTMLEELGWQDADEDGIREAHGVAGVTSGTVFSATLLTTEGDPARQRAAAVLKENLASCGVGLAVEYLPSDVFYADGPDGPVFGRQFDLALFSWLNGLGAPCELYLSTQIPDEQNWWATSNNPGYASEAYDAACQTATQAVYGGEAHLRAHHEAQRIFSQDLPVLPLYFVPRMVVVRSRVEGVTLDPSQQSAFWNIESIDVQR